jgi:CDP-glucose 4,6-dehydratase
VFLKDKKVLVTGHTGFKGSWLISWLIHLGAKVYGISKDIPTEPSMYNTLNLGSKINSTFIDIRNFEGYKKKFDEIKPDFLFHLAAQPIVREAITNPLDTILSNAIGMANTLEILRGYEESLTCVLITSDKVYENKEWVWGYRETDNLGGKDPYSASKSMAEIAVSSYCRTYFSSMENIRLGVGRAGNVIGGGDWADHRIVPDCVRSIIAGEELVINNPHSTRPWQHVLDPLSGYIKLAHSLNYSSELDGECYNFGPLPSDYTVQDLILEMQNHWQGIDYKINNSSVESVKDKEAKLLKLNCDKALRDLKWEPALDFKNTVKFTTDWYKLYLENGNQDDCLYNLTVQQIKMINEKYGFF